MYLQLHSLGDLCSNGVDIFVLHGTVGVPQAFQNLIELNCWLRRWKWIFIARTQTVSWTDSFPSGFSRSGCCWGEATTLVQWVCIVNQFLVETEAEIGEPASRAAKCHQPGPEHVAETSTIEAKAQTKTSAPRMWLKEHLNLGLAAWGSCHLRPGLALNYLLSIII